MLRPTPHRSQQKNGEAEHGQPCRFRRRQPVSMVHLSRFIILIKRHQEQSGKDFNVIKTYLNFIKLGSSIILLMNLVASSIMFGFACFCFCGTCGFHRDKRHPGEAEANNSRFFSLPSSAGSLSNKKYEISITIATSWGKQIEIICKTVAEKLRHFNVS